MNHETVEADLFERFPKLQLVRDTQFGYMGGEELGIYVAFGSVLIPALEQALAVDDLGSILPICAFLEDVAEAAEEDRGLEELLRVEIGEWLGGVANEASLTPWLGMKTKRICRYVPGLATQRTALRAERNRRGFTNRISSFLNRLRRK